MPVSNGSILIITIYVHVMRCNPEERRTIYSRHSFEWTGVREWVYMQWEEFHSFPIDRGWHKQSNHCTAVADLNHARHHTADRNCILLQDHRQQRILIAHSRPILILEDSFSPSSSHYSPTPLNIAARHLDDRYSFVVQNWRIPLRNGNLLEELSSWTEQSFVPCQLTWVSAQLSAFVHTRNWFVYSSHPWFHCALWLAFGLPRTPSFSPSASLCLLLSKTQLQKAFSLHAGALSLGHSPPQ